MERIAVIGSGAYGSYITDALLGKKKEMQITMFEAGNAKVQDEQGIGYRTNILGRRYLATSRGRFFGLGGSTNRWGGAILLFTENDFRSPGGFLQDIVALNEKYRSTVYRKFGFQDTFPEHRINERLFTKQGVWLGYFRRNLFRHFQIGRRSQVRIEVNARVTRFSFDADGSVTSMEYIQSGSRKEASFDRYFLAAGAFESHRILLHSGISLQGGLFRFSDHLSRRVFRIRGGTKIGKDEFAFRIRGTSFITNRIIGEIDGHSYFANPNYNKDFPLFQNLKALLFQRKFSFGLARSIIRDMPACLGFFWSALVKRRLYVYGDAWDLYIDCENPIGGGGIRLSAGRDRYGEPGLDLSFTVDRAAADLFERAREEIREYLVQNQVDFDEYPDGISVEKAEDTYHPFGMYFQFRSAEEYFNRFRNMLVVNTGVLPRAGGINSTAAMFPVIEEYINRLYGE